MADQILPQDLHKFFEYKDGILYWKVDRVANKLKGKPAGCIDGKGYLQTRINNVLYKNHRIIYAMFHNVWPKLIDHIDGNPLNNNIENLREATVSQNTMNSKIYAHNTTGIKGVEWNKRLQRWTVRIQVNGKRKYFGCYKDIDYATFVAEAMRYKYHGQFANNGK